MHPTYCGRFMKENQMNHSFILETQIYCKFSIIYKNIKTGKASKIVKAYTVFHNMCWSTNIPELVHDENILDGTFLNVFTEKQNNDLERARVLQRAIIQNHVG